MELSEIIERVELIALLAEEGGTTQASSNGRSQNLGTIPSAVTTVDQWHRLRAAVVAHKVHHMLNGEVVGQLRNVPIWNLGLYTTLWAADAPSRLSYFCFLCQPLQTVFTVGVGTHEDARL